MLFVSSTPSRSHPRLKGSLFQSRNRDAFRFKLGGDRGIIGGIAWFQSRNRDAFRFKDTEIHRDGHDGFRGFNLVIEMLFVSRVRRVTLNPALEWFQSRNRDAFRFKRLKVLWRARLDSSFNLVIEMLFVSSDGGYRGRKFTDSFNLVIEMLFVSRINWEGC